MSIETPDPIQKAWEEYHGPIDCGDGEEYIPDTPIIFRRGFIDGYEHAKKRARLELLNDLLGARAIPTITSRKIDEFLESKPDWQISGFVVSDEAGARGIIEMSACRWLSNDEMWKLMHPE